MTMGVTLTGMDETLRRIQKAVDSHGEVFRKNLIAAGLMLEAACTEKITEVLYSIPEDDDKERKRTGNLRASRFTMWTNSPDVAVPTFDVVEGEDPMLPGFRQTLDDAKKLIDAASSGKNKTAVVVGYGAYYAVYVHEGVEGKFQGFKWMELALNDLERDLISVLKRGGGAAT